MNLIQITRVGKDNKTAFESNEAIQFFVPKHLRDKATVGAMAIANPKTFTSRAKTDPVTGEVLTNADGTNQLEACEAWTRQDITFIGTEQECLKAFTSSDILAVKAKAYIAKETAVIAKEYDLSQVGAA